MSEKQKKHSKLFKRYGVLTAGKRLKDTPPSPTGDVNVAVEIPDHLLPEGAFDLNTYLQESACQADAVIVGTIKNKASQLTDDGTFAFTDYQITVDDVLKNNPGASISTGSELTVARAGGAVKLQGRTLRAVDQSEKPLGRNHRFLLFLKYLPETGDYQSLSGQYGDLSFELRGEKLSQVSDEALPNGASQDVDSTAFLNKIRAVAHGNCSK